MGERSTAKEDEQSGHLNEDILISVAPTKSVEQRLLPEQLLQPAPGLLSEPPRSPRPPPQPSTTPQPATPAPAISLSPYPTRPSSTGPPTKTTPRPLPAGPQVALLLCVQLHQPALVQFHHPTEQADHQKIDLFPIGDGNTAKSDGITSLNKKQIFSRHFHDYRTETYNRQK